MGKKSIKEQEESRVCWGELEGWLRGRMQELLQDVLEEEVTDFLGRVKSERRAVVDGERGYRNGYGKKRRLTVSCGTIEVQRPRLRDVEERFRSKILPLFARRTREVNELIPELYLHGLAEGDFDLALRGLLGEHAPISASTVARLKEKWQVELGEWQERRLDDLDIVYLWADGIYVKAGLEKEKAAVLVVLGALRDGSKRVLALRCGHRESIESWSELLRDLKQRGLRSPKLVIADGNLGLWGALTNIYPEAKEQRCWNHKIVNVLDRVPKKRQAQAKIMLGRIAYAETRKECEQLKRKFAGWCKDHRCSEAARILERDWERMVTFFDFPKEHWQHIRTTNPVESPFAALRLRTDAAKRFKKVENAMAVIWKMLLVAEKRFRRLKGCEHLEKICEGVVFVDGIEVKLQQEGIAA